MSMVPKRFLATAALGATLASTSIVETKAMPIPVTTADAIASPSLMAGAAAVGAGAVARWRRASSRAG